jgi:hypothetical protein
VWTDFRYLVVCGGFVHVSNTFFDHYFLKIFTKISWAVNSCFCYFIGRKVKPIEIRNASSTYVIFQNTCARIKRISANFRKDRSTRFLSTSNSGMLQTRGIRSTISMWKTQQQLRLCLPHLTKERYSLLQI